MDVTTLLGDPAAVGAVTGALALILFGAAWHKWTEPTAFLMSLAAYRLVPAPLLAAAARALPLAEAAVGVALLVPATHGRALQAAAVLFTVYGAAIAINLARGRAHIDCGCGGASHPLSWGLVVRNVVLAGAALAVGGPAVAREFGWLDGVTLVAGVLAFYAAYLTSDELLRQAGRIARTAQADTEGA